MVAHRLAVDLEIESPGIDPGLGIVRQAEPVVNLPAGIVEFVGSQSQPVPAPRILRGVVLGVVPADRCGVEARPADLNLAGYYLTGMELGALPELDPARAQIAPDSS